MRVHGDTTRSLGKAVDATSGAVTGWTKGAMPRPEAARRIAHHYGLSVEVLTDDSLDLPQAPKDYLNEAPIRTAVQLAEAMPGEQSNRQKAFEEYLSFLQSVRAAAEAFAPNDPAEARRRFDAALATWLAAQTGTVAEIAAANAKLDELKAQAAGNVKPGKERRHG
jgi:hypothetical protein